MEHLTWKQVRRQVARIDDTVDEDVRELKIMPKPILWAALFAVWILGITGIIGTKFD